VQTSAFNRIDSYNASRPHSALRAKSPLNWIAAFKAAADTITTDTPSDTSDTEPRFAGADGVKPRQATAEGGLAWFCF
jgi:hypothetical protein